MIKVKEQILRELQQNIGNPVSGQDLADRYGVSRNAIWKAVNSLKSEGYPILSDRKRGYYLRESSDLISEDSIRSELPDDMFLADGSCRVRICLFREIDSTNLEAQRMIADGFSDAALIIAERQTRGRGHNGSGFYSPASTGLYMTLLLPVNLILTEFHLVSRAAAVAAVEAVRELTGRSVQIRKVNDLYDGSRKVGGILCEATSNDLESGKLQEVCIGIGLNLTTTIFPEKTPVQYASIGGGCTRSQLAANITARLMRTDFEHPDDFLQKYKEYHLSEEGNPE